MLRSYWRLSHSLKARTWQNVRFKSSGESQVAPTAPRARGRPRKVKDEDAPNAQKEARKGGRSRQNSVSEAVGGRESLLANDSAMAKKIDSETTLKKRGRPKAQPDDSLATQTTSRKRVRSKTRPKSDDVEAVKPSKPKVAVTTSSDERAKKKTDRKLDSETHVPARLRALVASRKHHDLESFKAYAKAVNLKKDTTVYKGTVYEYIVGDVLATYNFSLEHYGRSNDKGIDLIGHWNLPAHSTEQLRQLRVRVQCKAYRPTPSMVRELEGAAMGAPAGWRGREVLALLVASKKTTKGVNAAVQTSMWPMAIMHIGKFGVLEQFLWNAAAAEIGLEGMGVSVRHKPKSQADENSNGLALTWMGELWQDPKIEKGVS